MPTKFPDPMPGTDIRTNGCIKCGEGSGGGLCGECFADDECKHLNYFDSYRAIAPVRVCLDCGDRREI